jgi:CMP-N,N'-diacetyllegionaminic acid synthase
MFDLKVLAIIPARGGSKGIPKKNIANLNGKPLICYTIDAAKKSKTIDRIFLSSNDDEIINVSKKNDLYSLYIRPNELSNDTALTTEAIFHAVDWLKSTESYNPDIIMILQPTSPLRTPEDIDNAVEQFIESSKNCLVSVNEMVEHPYECVKNIETESWGYLEEQDTMATRRQDYNDKFYYINGAIYITTVDFFNKERVFIKENSTSFYIMPPERSVDIDNYSDLEKVEYYLQKNLVGSLK